MTLLPNIENNGYFARALSSINKWTEGEVDCNKKKWWKSVMSPDVLGDFRTTDRALSWWYIDDLSESEINMLAASTLSVFRNKAGRYLNFVVIPAANLNKRFDMKSTPKHGSTALKEYEKHHYDMSDLTIMRVLSIINMIMPIVGSECLNGAYIKRVPVKVALDTLRGLKNDGNVRAEKLGDWVAEELGYNSTI